MQKNQSKTRTCIECGERKPLAEFYVKERRKWSTHYTSRCRLCHRDWMARLPGIGTINALSEPERAKRFNARRAVGQAVYRGKLKKPDRCSKCKDLTDAANLHGHHIDYDQKLEVIWLCRRCHHVA